MIDEEIRRVMAQQADHPLGGLEVDVWAALAAREQRRTAVRRLLAVQGVVLAVVLTGSVAAGKYLGSLHDRGVDVFSPHMSLSPATLLSGRAP